MTTSLDRFNTDARGAPFDREVVTPTIGGAGRFWEPPKGMLGALPAIGASHNLAILPRFVDRQKHKAGRLERIARGMQIPATGEDGLLEDAILDPEALGKPTWNTSDDLLCHSRVLRMTASSGQPVLGSLFSRFAATGELWGWRYGFQPSDIEGKQALARLFEALAPFTPPSHAADVFEGGFHNGELIEPPVRAWFAKHAGNSLERFASTRALTHHGCELTTDAGMTTLPAVVLDRGQLGDPQAIAEEFVDDPTFPIERSRDYLLVETAPKVVRFARIRVRKTDDRVIVRRTSTIPRPVAVDQRPVDRWSVTPTSLMRASD